MFSVSKLPRDKYSFVDGSMGWIIQTPKNILFHLETFNNNGCTEWRKGRKAWRHKTSESFSFFCVALIHPQTHTCNKMKVIAAPRRTCCFVCAPKKTRMFKNKKKFLFVFHISSIFIAKRFTFLHLFFFLRRIFFHVNKIFFYTKQAKQFCALCAAINNMNSYQFFNQVVKNFFFLLYFSCIRFSFQPRIRRRRKYKKENFSFFRRFTSFFRKGKKKWGK